MTLILPRSVDPSGLTAQLRQSYSTSGNPGGDTLRKEHVKLSTKSIIILFSSIVDGIGTGRR